MDRNGNHAAVDLAWKEFGWVQRAPVSENDIPEYDASQDVHCSFRPPPKAKQRLPPVVRAAARQGVANPFVNGGGDRPQPQQAGAGSGPGTLEQVFGFSRQAGGDPKLELVCLKTILIREGYIGRLQALAFRLANGDDSVLQTTEGGGGFLEILMQTRQASLAVVRAVSEWAGSFAQPPQPETAAGGGDARE